MTSISPDFSRRGLTRRERVRAQKKKNDRNFVVFFLFYLASLFCFTRVLFRRTHARTRPVREREWTFYADDGRPTKKRVGRWFVGSKIIDDAMSCRVVIRFRFLFLSLTTRRSRRKPNRKKRPSPDDLKVWSYAGGGHTEVSLGGREGRELTQTQRRANDLHPPNHGFRA